MVISGKHPEIFKFKIVCFMEYSEKLQTTIIEMKIYKNIYLKEKVIFHKIISTCKQVNSYPIRTFIKQLDKQVVPDRSCTTM